MNQLEKFLSKQNETIREDREKTLIALGLIEKEYSPDGKESYRYPKCDYIGGEKKYYREVAINVTDEEWAQILSVTKQVEEIERRKEAEREKDRNRSAYRVVKKWIPVFSKPKDTTFSSSTNEEPETGKSHVATVVKLTAWLIGIIGIIGGIIAGVSIESFTVAMLCILGAAVEIILASALADIMNNLAELTTIARNGFKYNETNEK